jgi:hypothetical protein
MQKEAMDKCAKVLKEASAVILQVTAERDEALAKVAAFERRDRAVKVASEMHRKGIDDTPFNELVERLTTFDEQGKLASVEQAVELVGPDMGRKLASLSDDRGTSVGSNDLERYLMDNA